MCLTRLLTLEFLAFVQVKKKVGVSTNSTGQDPVKCNSTSVFGLTTGSIWNDCVFSSAGFKFAPCFFRSFDNSGLFVRCSRVYGGTNCVHIDPTPRWLRGGSY